MKEYLYDDADNDAYNRALKAAVAIVGMSQDPVIIDFPRLVGVVADVNVPLARHIVERAVKDGDIICKDLSPLVGHRQGLYPNLDDPEVAAVVNADPVVGDGRPPIPRHRLQEIVDQKNMADSQQRQVTFLALNLYK